MKRLIALPLVLLPLLFLLIIGVPAFKEKPLPGEGRSRGPNGTANGSRDGRVDGQASTPEGKASANGPEDDERVDLPHSNSREGFSILPRAYADDKKPEDDALGLAG